MMKYKVFENGEKKFVRSENYNYNFDKKTGEFIRWGKTLDDDPVVAPSCEIADIEISTICSGIGKTMETRHPCSWCYKSNTNCGTNMSFDTFKKVFNKINKNKLLTQIAFGIGDIDGCPDLWKIMEYTREHGVIPNITTNGMGVTDEIANRLANLCGAVSVSRYHLPDVCYNAVAKLVDSGLQQTNIHQLLALETYDSCFKLLDDIDNDDRLSGLNAVVFLMLKPKGDRNKFHAIESIDKFSELISEAQNRGVKVGMDSCTAPLMLQHAITHGQEKIIPSIEPCESFGLFSSYINVFGDYFPCSFAEGEGEWKDGISVVDCEDFIKDVWFSDKLNRWRNISLSSTKSCTHCSVQKYCRACPIFDITHCLK